MRLAIHQKHLDDILNAVVLYYPSNRPKLLSSAARGCFSALMSYDGALVYQKLLSCNHVQSVNDPF